MANIKTPISLLQEILAQQQKHPPIYSEVPSDLNQFSFKCMVKFELIEAFGYANTKKEAKQNSAQQALLKMGVGSSSVYVNQNNNMVIAKSVVAPMNLSNYTGILHERAAVNHVPHPKYCDKFPQNGVFVVECNFMNFTVEGYGSTKKQAKQEASRKMIEKLEKEDVNYKLFQRQTISTENTDFINQVIERFEQISINNEQSVAPGSDFDLPRVEMESESFTLEELVERLKSIGHECSIEVFQRDPYIMVLKIGRNSCVAMGHGKTKQAAMDYLLDIASIMFEGGFSFKPPF